MLGAYARDVDTSAGSGGDAARAPGPRVGVFGGTFDRVLMVVANVPWQKAGRRVVSAAEDRFRMVEAAVAGVAGLEVSRLEIDRGGPSYIVDTVGELLEATPSAQPYVIVGADVATELETWQRVAELRAAVTLVV